MLVGLVCFMPTDWGGVIEAAASPWGLAALMVLVIGTVALTLFRDTSAQVRLACFGIMFVGAALFIQEVISHGSTIAHPPTTTTAPPRRQLDPKLETDDRARLADTEKRISDLRQTAGALSAEVARAREANDPPRQATAQQRLDSVSRQLDQLTDLRDGLRRQLGQ
jgi:hypothetical protein